MALVLALMGGLAMGVPLVYALLVRPDPAQDWPLLLTLYAGAVGLAGVVNYLFGDHISTSNAIFTAGVLEVGDHISTSNGISTAGLLETLSWLIGQAAVYLAYGAACGYVLLRSVPPPMVALLLVTVLVAGAIVVRLSILVSDLTARAENRALGGVGAFLTFVAFAIQFGLAVGE